VFPHDAARPSLALAPFRTGPVVTLQGCVLVVAFKFQTQT